MHDWPRAILRQFSLSHKRRKRTNPSRRRRVRRQRAPGAHLVRDSVRRPLGERCPPDGRPLPPAPRSAGRRPLNARFPTFYATDDEVGRCRLQQTRGFPPSRKIHWSKTAKLIAAGTAATSRLCPSGWAHVSVQTAADRDSAESVGGRTLGMACACSLARGSRCWPAPSMDRLRASFAAAALAGERGGYSAKVSRE